MKKLFSLIISAIIVFSCFSYCSVGAVESSTEALPAAEEGFISWFTYGMTVGEAKEISPALKSFSRDGNTLADGDIIFTGDKVTTDNDRYTAVVRGDIFGDGEISIFSYLTVKSHCMSTHIIEDSATLLAADVNSDGAIDLFDCVVLKNIHFGSYEIPLPENATQVPILLYHHILPDAHKAEDKWMGNDITIATSEFKRHLQMLKDGNHYVATMDEVVAYIRGEILLPPGSVLLTFDDGYKSNTYYAAPILRDFGYTATVFSIMCYYITDYEDEYDYDRLQHITAEDLAPNTDVFTQQCHTYANHNLLADQNFDEIYGDFMLSQEVHHSDYFAYPMGSYDSEVIRAVKAAGFKAAFATTPVPAKPGDKIYEIPRITITSPMADSDYLKLLDKAY